MSVRSPRPRHLILTTATLIAAAALPAADPVLVSIDLTQRGHAVSPLLHGLFFEDINYAGDGGLYAELVQNRSFEHLDHLYSWGIVRRRGKGDIAIESQDGLNANNPHFARLTVADAGDGVGLANHGFGGIVIEAGKNYLVSAHSRVDAAFASAGGRLRAAIEDETGRSLGECMFETGAAGEWRKLERTIAATGPALHGRLVVLATAAGQVDLDMISLFPEHTWKNRRNGVRADLVQLIADMKPAFLRFPGGCIVEGMNLDNRYQWKETIGDVAERRQNWNRWQDAIRSETAPQYYQTYGLGFFEYFQLCEDIGAEPVPIINCGMACQYQSKELVPIEELDPFVQDALDLIEFANGSASSEWGSKRAAMGHPEPFHLKFIGVGNEQWGEAYFERYMAFQKAIKARHPDMQIVSTAGPGVDDGHWKLAWDKFRAGLPAEVVDEHFYRPPQWFIENATRYDAQDRHGPKVFAGEFAAHEGRPRKNNLRGAICEAAFMTGLLRNSDIVTMSAYAPLFAKVGASQWAPDLIWFDNSRVFGTPSYHVQALFSLNRPDSHLPTKVDGPAVSLPPLPRNAVATSRANPLEPYRPESVPALFAAAGRENGSGEVVLFIANPYGEERRAVVALAGLKKAAGGATWDAIELTSSNPDDENSLQHPDKIAPRAFTLAGEATGLSHTFPPWSLTVLRAKAP